MLVIPSDLFPVALAIAPAVIAASIAITVAFLTPAATSLRTRRAAINDKFDAALAALLLAQVARYSPRGMNDRPAGWTAEQHQVFNQRMSEKGVEHFIERTAEAKAALAAIEQYVPELRERLTRDWELLEADEPVLRAAIEARRPAAAHSERLFRQRKPLVGR